MANQPHADKQAVTYRLHRELVARLHAEALARGVTVVDLVSVALERELARPTSPPSSDR